MEIKKLNIVIDEVSAQIIANTLEYYNLYMLEEAERQDPYKDNSPYIKAIKNFLQAYKKALMLS